MITAFERRQLALLLLLPFALTCSHCKYSPAPEATGIAGERGAPDAILGHHDDVARFLAGLPAGRGSAFGGLRRTGTWNSHQQEMNQMFAHFSRNREQPIRNWRSRELAGEGSGTLFYPFGGPDFLFANSFFPHANRYILVGLEGADPLPQAQDLGWSDVSSLSNLRTSLKSVVYHSYFITKDMRRDLANTRLRGALPPILVFLARTGHRVQSVHLIDLTSGGAVVSRSGGGAAPGLHIVARSPSGGTKQVYYFQEDLSNSGLGSDQRLLRFATSQGSPVTFLKSASYLMHKGRFSIIRNAILDQSRIVVTDPSGVPFRHFNDGSWKVQLYGDYRGTLDMFKEYHQSDLAAAYRSGNRVVKPLPFGVGYKQTSLIVARRGR